MKIIAFGGSNSRNSINKKLATYVANLFENAEVEVLDLNDYTLPLFSVDLEKEIGKPKAATDFLNKIGEAELLVVSLAENNRNYSAAFKNLFDWCSRQQIEVFQQKPMLLMATSPGRLGGEAVLEIATKYLPRFGGNIVATFSLPLFNENFDLESNTISEPMIDNQIRDIVKNLSF